MSIETFICHINNWNHVFSARKENDVKASRNPLFSLNIYVARICNQQFFFCHAPHEKKKLCEIQFYLSRQ